MKWAFLTVLVVVGGAVAAFAIYTFAWRDNENGNERGRARLAAEQFIGTCRDEEPADTCTLIGVERISEGLWRMRGRRQSSGNVSCFAIDLDHFRVASNAETFHGIARVDCPGESRSRDEAPAEATPPPNYWPEDRAAQRLGHTRWAINRQVDDTLTECLGVGKPMNEDLYRVFDCKYVTIDSQEGLVTLRVTGTDTFKIEPK